MAAEYSRLEYQTSYASPRVGHPRRQSSHIRGWLGWADHSQDEMKNTPALAQIFNRDADIHEVTRHNNHPL
mgnify:CR=1 FL=1